MVDVCEFYKKLTDKKLFEKNSASFTVFVEGVENNRNIMAKIFPDIKEEITAGSVYEQKVYEKITNEIYNIYSPNFIPLLASGKCNKDILDEFVLQELEKIYYRIKYSKICFIITPKIDNMISLSNFVEKSKRERNVSQQDVFSVIFQTVFALAVLQQKKIQHNDLHSRNILIEVLKEPMKCIFDTGIDKYYIKTKYKPLLFDWDQAYCEELGPNEHLKSRCTRNNACNIINPKFDLYTIFCMLNYSYPSNFYKYYRNVQTYIDQEYKYFDSRLLNADGFSELEQKNKIIYDSNYSLSPKYYREKVFKILDKSTFDDDPMRQGMDYILTTKTSINKEDAWYTGYTDIILDQVQRNYLVSISTKLDDVYKVDGKKFKEIVGKDFSDTLTSVLYKLYGPIENEYILFIFKGQSCRMTVDDQKLPTPEDMLKSRDFSSLIATNEELKNNVPTYNLPKPLTIHGITKSTSVPVSSTRTRRFRLNPIGMRTMEDRVITEYKRSPRSPQNHSPVANYGTTPRIGSNVATQIIGSRTASNVATQIIGSRTASNAATQRIGSRTASNAVTIPLSDYKSPVARGTMRLSEYLGRDDESDEEDNNLQKNNIQKNFDIDEKEEENSDDDYDL